MSAYADFLARATRTHGDRFTPPLEADRFARYLHDYTVRVTVERVYPSGETWRRTGYIGVTTGWSPAFLLLTRITSRGSSDVLGAGDRIVSVKTRRARS
jgi:hypothetical protein